MVSFIPTKCTMRTGKQEAVYGVVVALKSSFSRFHSANLLLREAQPLEWIDVTLG